MKIAQIVASLEARHGGPSRSVRGLASGLAQIGHKVGLLSTVANGDGAARTVGNLDTRNFPREWPRSLCPSEPLRRHLLAGGYEVVHHHGLWLRTLHYARLAAVKSSAPLVISPRGMMSPWAWNHHRSKKSLASRFIHPGAFTTAAGWHVTSDEEAKDIRRLGFTQPVCVAPNGVLPPSAEEETDAAAHWRDACPALAGRRVALFYSRLHAKKRVLELIDLWLSVPRGDWVLLLAGIPEEYTVRQLEAYVLRQGGTGRIFVHDGTDAPPPYAVASLFLLPSHSENFGLVVAESLARGVPVLTTDATPWSKLESTGAGHCVPWDRFGQTVNTLLAETPDALAARGQLGVAWVREEFSWERTARILGSFYEELRIAAR
ncbi:MAG: glycosyltransferase [Opitutaceae bacterium]|jgi:glycosyltransferase involved in cell wall biosynthesis